jgi:2-oxo-4-hydroxy-4-carboxy-5-ureidoimidazoline decarboxylase
MSKVLALWNTLSEDEAASQLLPCCGSRGWAAGMAGRRPLGDEAALLAAADKTWRGLAVKDWMEAFASHPRIGERKAPQSATAQSAAWSAQEQRDAVVDDAVKAALAAGNAEYERRFGRVFLVCATGNSASEILEILRRRLRNDDEAELTEAAEEQRKITAIRLKKWLQG